MSQIRHMFTCMGVALLVGGVAAPALAQPRKDKREERRENRQERREERREDRQDKREELKEKRQERRETYKEKKARHAELKEKQKNGDLSDEEKAELERMEKNYERIKKKHEELKARFKERKENWKERRNKARKAWLDKWGELHKMPAVKAELAKHARRVAYLQQVRLVCEAEEDTGCVERADGLLAKENARHDGRMNKLKGGQ